MEQWEYDLRADAPNGMAAVQDWLNELGRQGWELCGIWQAPDHRGGVYYLKRRREGQYR